MSKKVFRRVWKVSAQQLENIKQESANGLNKKQIARMVGLHPGTVYAICKRNQWPLVKMKRKRKSGGTRAERADTPILEQRSDAKLDQLLELLSAKEAGYLSAHTFKVVVAAIL